MAVSPVQIKVSICTIVQSDSGWYPVDGERTRLRLRCGSVQEGFLRKNVPCYCSLVWLPWLLCWSDTTNSLYREDRYTQKIYICIAILNSARSIDRDVIIAVEYVGGPASRSELLFISCYFFGVTSFPTHLPISQYISFGTYPHHPTTIDQLVMSNEEAEKKVLVEGQEPIDEAPKDETKEQANE